MKSFQKQLQDRLANSRIAVPAAIVLIVSIVGVTLLLASRAATPSLSAEPEKGTILAPALSVSDTSASNGKAIKFAATSTPAPTPTPTPTPSPTPTPVPAPVSAGKSWQLSFSEEFNGTDYDHSKLTPCFDWNSGGCTSSFNKGREHYMPSQVQVSGGSAKLIAAPLSPPFSDSACLNNSCTYKSGLLSTARPIASNPNYLYKFTYGYVESRMKFPGTRGFFTAFWMLPANPSYSYRSEIDIVEILGDDPNTIFMTYHYNNRSQSHAVNTGKLNNGACAAKNYSTDWVTFGMDWQPTHVAWYINGVKCGQFDGNATTIENGPMQIILDLMVDHQWQRDWGVTLQDQTLTRQMELDYLRVYQQK